MVQIHFGLSMFIKFWKKPSSKREPGDIADADDVDDVAPVPEAEHVSGDGNSELETVAPLDLETGLVTTTDDLPSSWRRRRRRTVRTLKRLYQVMISKVLRRKKNSISEKSLDQQEAADQSAKEPSSSGEFKIGLDELVRLVKHRSTEALNRYKGVEGLSDLLKSDLEKGIDRRDEEILHRRKKFGPNTYPCRKGKSFWCFLWRACQCLHFLVIMLAAVYILLKLIDTKAVLDRWYVEACIILATVFDIIAKAIAEYKQSSWFEKLTEEKRNVHLDVIRGGRRLRVSIYDIVVGDVVPLKNGCQVPADGVLFDANSLKVDEQEITGLDEIVQKDLQRDPFLSSGSKVIEGIGTMLVTSVGKNTEWWLKMEEIPRGTEEEKPFEGYLNCITITVSCLVFFATVPWIFQLGLYFSGQTKKSDGTPMFIRGNTSANEATEFVIKSLGFVIATIIVALPVGLPTAVRLNLAKTTRKMMTDKVLVQTLSACETMGSVTTILCHKTGILTLNEMSVVDVWAGGIRVQDMEDVSQLPLSLKELIIEGIAQNTNGSVVFEPGVTEPEVYGTPTEQAILSFGNKLGMKFDDARSASLVHRTIPFNPKKKYGGVALQLGTQAHIHWKGSAKVILRKCKEYMDGANNPRAIDEQQRKFFEGIIENMCKEGLRCAALAYQPYELRTLPTDKECTLIPQDLVLLAIIGIKDPCRPDTRDAIQLCNSGSVKKERLRDFISLGKKTSFLVYFVCMVTDDNLLTAQAIAMECGILKDASGSNIRTGAQFRNLSEREREQIAEDILVLAESSPSDNLLLVQALTNTGHVVAATGMGIHDPKTLVAADVSLAMGIGGTTTAKEKSDIIILDDNFATIVKCIIWCRSLYTNVQISILFRLTASVSALAVCVVEVVRYDAFPLNAAQLLFINLIIDIFGALALAYRPRADRHLMGKPPVGTRDPLITKTMWFKLTVQAFNLVLILGILNSEKLLRLNHGHTGNAQKVMNTFIFYCFVSYPVLNDFEIKSVDHTFKDILRENMFLVTISSTIISQIIVMELAGIFVPSVRLDLKKWAIASLLGLLSQVASRFPYPANQYYRS